MYSYPSIRNNKCFCIFNHSVNFHKLHTNVPEPSQKNNVGADHLLVFCTTVLKRKKIVPLKVEDEQFGCAAHVTSP